MTNAGKKRKQDSKDSKDKARKLKEGAKKFAREVGLSFIEELTGISIRSTMDQPISQINNQQMQIQQAQQFATQCQNQSKEGTMNDELQHHGILGMKWGVRRYQNEDGSLTAAGKKRYNTVESAVKYNKHMSDYYNETAKQNEKDKQAYAERYSGSKEKEERYLQDMYGDDWKDREYMKDVFDVDDVYKHAKESINEDLELFDEDTKIYQEMGKEYMNKAKEYMSTPIAEISNSMYKQAKKDAKEYRRSVGD